MEKEKKISQSRGYPGASLEECVGFIKLINEKLGIGMLLERDQIAEAIGYSASGGAGQTKVAALVHFGFLGKESGKYNTTESVSKIIHPCSNNELQDEIKNAFLRPKLYGEIIEAYKDSGRIPQHIANILHRQFHVSSFACETAAKYFMESGRFAGVIDEEGKFKLYDFEGNSVDGNEEIGTKKNNEEAENDSSLSSSVPSPKINRQQFTFKVSSGTVILDVPDVLSSKDMQLLKKQLEVLELQVEMSEQLAGIDDE